MPSKKHRILKIIEHKQKKRKRVCVASYVPKWGRGVFDLEIIIFSRILTSLKGSVGFTLVEHQRRECLSVSCDPNRVDLI